MSPDIWLTRQLLCAKFRAEKRKEMVILAEIMPHIRLSVGQAAPYALLPGDPARLDRISHDSFYIDHEEEICAYWSGKGVLGSDMETAAVFVTGGLRGVKTASILNTVVEYQEELSEQINSYTDGESAMMRGEQLEILTALDAFVRLNQSGS